MARTLSATPNGLSSHAAAMPRRALSPAPHRPPTHPPTHTQTYAPFTGTFRPTQRLSFLADGDSTGGLLTVPQRV